MVLIIKIDKVYETVIMRGSVGAVLIGLKEIVCDSESVLD